MGTRQRTGARGEDLACRALEGRGYRVVARNWRPAPAGASSVTYGPRLRGEVDIIARDGDQWVFVEVKTRKAGGAQPAGEALGRLQLRRLTRLAETYLAQEGLTGVDWRIDLVAIDVGASGAVHLDVVQALVAD